VLACVYVAIKATETPAHKELIDMVIAVKESGRVTQLESISKTKVRGILALLKHCELLGTKHCELLDTQGLVEQNPVELVLAPGKANSIKMSMRLYLSLSHELACLLLTVLLLWQRSPHSKCFATATMRIWLLSHKSIACTLVFLQIFGPITLFGREMSLLGVLDSLC
jgi:hypothetical protein